MDTFLFGAVRASLFAACLPYASVRSGHGGTDLHAFLRKPGRILFRPFPRLRLFCLPAFFHIFSVRLSPQTVQPLRSQKLNIRLKM